MFDYDNGSGGSRSTAEVKVKEIAEGNGIRNNEFIEKPIPAHPSCRLDSLLALRNIYMLLFVIPDVTLVSNDNRPLKAHKHFETPCIPLQSL